jgi:hypothetical protein
MSQLVFFVVLNFDVETNFLVCWELLFFLGFNANSVSYLIDIGLPCHQAIMSPIKTMEQGQGQQHQPHHRQQLTSMP